MSTIDKELNAFMIYLLLEDYDKDKLIEIINKVDKVMKNIDIFIDERIETNKGMVFLKGGYEQSMNYLRVRLHDKLKELKGSDKNEKFKNIY